MKKSIFVLFVILLLAGFLRFWQLSSNPPSLTWDEAAWGYNAYSLGIDGKDEFGRFLPHDFLESFGDYKPPVYAYLDILPVKIFGLTEFATRFPSALLGTLTVLITYFLAFRIFRSAEKKKHLPNPETIGLLSAFLLAISPWHINLSRAAFEANVATFFLVLGVFLFLKSVQEKSYVLIFSAVSFVLSIYTFNTARVVAPLLVVLLGIGFRKQLFSMKRQVVFAVIVGILLVLPTVKFLLSPQANLRFREVNIFSDGRIIEQINQEIANDKNAWWSKIIHNRRLAYGVEYIKHYLDNFSPDFLFLRGDGNPKFSTRDVGQLYLWELPIIIIGLLYLFKQKQGFWWVIPAWLIIGIIPAATARETPHALRIETTLPTFQILTAYGFISLYYLCNKPFRLKHISKNIILGKYVFLSVGVVIILFYFLYYTHGYFSHYPKKYSGEWQYGYKESIAYTQSQYDRYSNLIITDELGRPYIYYLFYTKMDPQTFRNNSVIKRNVFGFVNVEKVGKYQFARSRDMSITGKKNTLFINYSKLVPEGVTIVKEFKLLNDESVLTAYTY